MKTWNFPAALSPLSGFSWTNTQVPVYFSKVSLLLTAIEFYRRKSQEGQDIIEAWTLQHQLLIQLLWLSSWHSPISTTKSQGKNRVLEWGIKQEYVWKEITNSLDLLTYSLDGMYFQNLGCLCELVAEDRFDGDMANYKWQLDIPDTY